MQTMKLTEAQEKSIGEIAYVRNGMYGNLDFSATLDYMNRRYVQPISKLLDISEASLADCAAGFGWLSFAFLLAGGKSAILIDADAPRIEAAAEIAQILGIHSRCIFKSCYLQDVELGTDSVDIFACIETLEHVGKENIYSCWNAITDAAKHIVVLTTPNKLFPVLAHDTRLPFAHWLPFLAIKPYAKLFNRDKSEMGNYFLGPWHLSVLRKKFVPMTPFQTFADISEFDRFYPHYLPYGDKPASRIRQRPSKLQRYFVYWTGKILGVNAHFTSPNLSTVWQRR
ncbi:MAG: hypothetical protein IPG20_11350 [Gammaproteobacteria bacterium]|nr:hypothetical protein [Gammaproteobacteria bacterium]